MKRDYSKLPVKLTLVNNTDNDVNIDLRDTFIQILVNIEKGNTIDINVSTSEDLAVAIARATELGIETSFEQVTPGPEPEEPTEVGTEEDLKEAIASGAKDIKLTDNITVPSGNLNIAGVTHFDGNGKTITFETTGQNFVATTNGTVIENVVVNNTVANEDWSSTYGIQVYNGTYTIKNCTAKGCNGGILINGATATLEGTIDVSGNEFGGIEVSKGSASGLGNATLNINGATIVNTTEAYKKPTIWTDGEGNTVNGAEAMFTNTAINPNQVQYYLVEANSKDPIIYNVVAQAPEGTTDLLGKTANDLQSNIVVGETDIQGTLNYVTDYTGFSSVSEDQEGNYLALKIEAKKNDTDIEKVSVTLSDSQSEVFLDADKLHVVRLVNKDQTLTIKAYENEEVVATKEYNLSNLTLGAKPTVKSRSRSK